MNVTKEEFGSILRMLGYMGLTQVTDKEEIARWTNGDWKKYFLLFRDGSDNAKVDIINGVNDETILDIAFLSEITSYGKKIYGNGLHFVLNEPIEINELQSMLRWNCIYLAQPDLTMAKE